MLVGTEFGSVMSDGPVSAAMLILGLILGVVVIVCGLLLSREVKPNWHGGRVTKAAGKAASRWAAKKPKI